MIATLSFAQDVKVELSVRYETMRNDFVDSVTVVPFLDITYRNDGEKDVFLRGVCQNTYYPVFVGLALENIPYEEYMSPDRLRNRAFHHLDYEEDFRVVIGDVWVAYDSSQSIEDDVELRYINDDFCYMYEWKTRQDYAAAGLPSDFSVQRSSDPNLVFLKSGESFVNSFNLMAFFINKGSFLFCIDPSYRANTFPIHCWNNSEKRFSNAELLLPDAIGKYKRCDDEILIKDAFLNSHK